ncbi:alpha/beta fold hydrolase [Nocardia sp. NPDC003482]
MRTLMVDVPGGSLFCEIRGRGPVLLLLPGGDGDADTYDRLADHLASTFTVVTYDRRGLSRSATAPTEVTIASHADDAAAILAATTDTPALVFGSSIGAVIALQLTLAHPDLVRRAMLHEPPLSAVLDEPARTELRQAQHDVETAYASTGIEAAMARFLRLIDFDPTDREPDVELTPPDPQRLANLTVFLTHDAPAVRRYEPDLTALRTHAPALTPAIGATTTGLLHQCTTTLAALLGTETHTLPSGHIAPTLRPRAMADALRAFFTEDTPGAQQEA